MSTVARFGVQPTRAGTARKLPRIDPSKYGRLLKRAAPMVIETDAEYQRMLARLEQLMEKDDVTISPGGGPPLETSGRAPGGI